jgi:ABC-type dipeptide/oligopeptide/nickel transport system permease component
MSKYFVRRVLILIPVLAGISLVLFTILALAPGDPFEELATNPNVPPEVRMNLRAQFGLDDPIAVRYLRWFTAMLKGDWGFSFVSRVNVVTLIMQRLPTTIAVIGSAQLLGLLIAIPIGVYSATRPYSLFDQIATTAPSWASRCRPSSPASSSSSSSASIWTGSPSSTARTSPPRAGGGGGSTSGRPSCRWPSSGSPSPRR